MKAALPHCDALVSGHTFAALAEVAEAIARRATSPPPEPPPEDGAGAVGERHAGPGQLGGDAERLRPEPRQDDAGVVDR